MPNPSRKSLKQSGSGVSPLRQSRDGSATFKTLGEITEARVEQTGPSGRTFSYVDIGSIELETKRIIEPKVLDSSEAPSRAKQVLKKGDVLVSMTRPNRNAVALVSPELDGAIGSTGFHVLRSKDAVPGFLFYAVQTNRFIETLCEKVQGALYPAVRPRDISSFQIFVPPLPEQRRIVAEIEKQFSRLEEGVSALKRVQANLKRYRAAVLKAACEGKLVPTEAELKKSGSGVSPLKKSRDGSSILPYETGEQLLKRILDERRKNWQGRGQYKEPAAPDSTNLPQLPDGWTWASVEQISESIVDCPHSTPKWTPSGHLCVRTTEFRPGRLDLSEARYVTYNERVSRLVPKEGDILYSREGGILGIACQVPHGVNLCLGQRMMLIRAGSRIIGTFVMNWLNSSVVLSHVKGLTTGSASPHLNVGEIRLFPVPLPPLAEQKRIVEEVERRLSVVEELESLVTTNLQRATRLRQSILQKAFEGKLVV